MIIWLNNVLKYWSNKASSYTVNKQGCDLFFQVISNRYEMGSVIITANRPFREWDEIFNGDSTLAGAIIDRLIHHSEVIKIEGDSYRVKSKNQK